MYCTLSLACYIFLEGILCLSEVPCLVSFLFGISVIVTFIVTFLFQIILPEVWVYLNTTALVPSSCNASFSSL
jgi:hypothetical protein